MTLFSEQKDGFDGTWIRSNHSKTGRKVNVPVTRRLGSVLENTPQTSPVILTNTYGRTWQLPCLPWALRELASLRTARNSHGR